MKSKFNVYSFQLKVCPKKEFKDRYTRTYHQIHEGLVGAKNKTDAKITVRANFFSNIQEQSKICQFYVRSINIMKFPTKNIPWICVTEKEENE